MFQSYVLRLTGYNTSDKDWHLSSVMDEIHLRHMLVTCFYLYQSLHYGATVLTMEDQYLLNSLVISIMSTKKTVSKDDLLSWVGTTKKKTKKKKKKE